MKSLVIRRMLPLAMALGVTVPSMELFAFVAAPQVVAESPVVLKLRRLGDRVDVVVNGLSADARVVSQSSSPTQWSGQLRAAAPLSLRRSQEVELAEAGLKSIRLSAQGQGGLELVVKASQGMALPDPMIRVDGNSLIVSFARLPIQTTALTSGRLDLSRPGRVAQPVFAPPIRPRAVSPPLGDMAVGTMLVNNRSFVKASGPPVSLTLNNASAKDALMSLARLGGYGFVFVGQNADANSSEGDAGANGDYPVTMAFKSERYDRALNSVLMASGLQGRLEGGTLLVGTKVSAKSFGPQMSKVFRLNQVDVESASTYLGNLGAEIKVATTSTTTSRESESSGTSSNSSESSTSTTSSTTKVDSYGSGVGPLVGLVGTTDARLNTITLVGDPSLINVAQGYLKQIDLRKRQVAVKVQILNVTLDNDASIDSSFSAKIGDTFIVSQSGKAHMNFGKYKPGGAAGTGVYDGKNPQIPGAYPDSADVEIQRSRPPVVPLAESTQVVATVDENGNVTGYDVVRKPLLVNGQEVYVPDANPNLPPELVPVYDKYGRPKLAPKKELNRYNSNSFYAYLESVIVSSSSKIIAQPTVLVQEGEEALVRSGESVITGVSKTEAANGSTEFSNTRVDAGLTVNLEVEKIDDNGFVTMKLDPTISVPVSAGTQEGVQIFNIVERKLNSGRIRLRDQQTLILTGVIQESDRQLARKWPILGDLPLIGQLFRSSSSTRQKNELVVIVTPSILDDENGGAYGYGYKPGTPEATRMIGSGGYRY